MQVRYHPVLGWVFLGLGTACAGLGGWLSLVLGELQVSVFAGLLCTALGVAYLARPYFEVDQYAVTMRAPIGPVKRQFPLSASRRLVADGSRLVIVDGDGTTKKLPVRRWMARGSDWDAAVASVATPRP